MQYDYDESTQLIKSLWRFIRPREVRRLKERRAYVRDVGRIKKKVRERKEDRGEDISLRKLARRCGINESTFCCALAPSVLEYGNRNHRVLFSALSKLRMLPSEPLRERFEQDGYRTYGNPAI